MKTFLSVVLGIVIIALGAVVVICFNLSAENSALTEELDATTLTLVQTQNDLEDAQVRLSITENKLAEAEEELSAITTELTQTKKELNTTSRELASTKESLQKASADIENLEESLAEAQYRLNLAEDTLQGLGITVSTSVECWDAALVDNEQAANPTLAEVKTFLAQDTTENHPYILHEYDCSEFSRDVHNRAEAAGIRAAVVHVDFRSNMYGHALNAFLTSDYGIVYIDCTGAPDCIARVVSGKTYRSAPVNTVPPQNIRNNAYWDNLWTYYYIENDYGGEAITDSITFFW